jgi:hypothetical protein
MVENENSCDAHVYKDEVEGGGKRVIRKCN